MIFSELVSCLRATTGGNDRRGYKINWIFVVFGLVSVLGGTVCALFAIETKGRVLEEISPS